MNKRLLIDYDDKIEKFTIICPMWANDLVKSLPSVRWNSSRRAWLSPVTRRNIEVIEERLSTLTGVELTDAAKAKIEASKNVANKATANKAGWPFWYSFKTDPRKYQMKALQKGYPLDAFGLFMDPGTGKSKTVIDLACAYRMEGIIGSWLIICKHTLRDNWLEQLNTHATIPMDIHLPDTTKKAKYERWLQTKHDFKVLIAGTESFSAGGMADMVEQFLRVSFRPMGTVDESSMIASHDANRSQKIVGMRRYCVKRQAMTGTPIRDNPLNIYMQFEWLDPDIIGIGDFYAFRNRYANLVPMQDTVNGKVIKFHKVAGYQNIDELVSTIAPYVFQITKDEAKLDLPPKRYQKRVIPMSKEQRSLYDQIRKDRAWEFNGDEKQVIENVLTYELRLHQVCGGFTVKARDERRTVKGEEKIKRVYDPVVIFEDPAKNPKVAELLDILDEYRDQQTIVWCMYVPEIQAIQAAMKKRGMPPPALYYGEVDAESRDAYDKGFKSGKYKVMLANPQTGSMGLTWVSKDAVVVYYSNSNKLEDRVQSEDRAHRIGSQGDSVMYIDLIMERSVDQLRKASIETKQDLSDYIRSRIRFFTPDDLADGVIHTARA